MKKYIDIYKNNSSILFSFEFFPPKNENQDIKLYEAINKIMELEPDFFTFTYGAAGSAQEKSLNILENIKKNFSISFASHITLIDHTETKMNYFLSKINQLEILNLIVLRGDLPAHQTFGNHELQYASDLARLIKSTNKDLCLGGACYPEKHSEAISLEKDVENLKIKIDSGTEFLFSQLFFSNENWFDFINLITQKGINVPIIPGIMPIYSYEQIERIQKLTSCSFPSNFLKNLEKLKTDKNAFYEFSLEFTVNQCKELLDSGVKAFHLYTLNDYHLVYSIVKQLKLLK